jgi:hypothetical protein
LQLAAQLTAQIDAPTRQPWLIEQLCDGCIYQATVEPGQALRCAPEGLAAPRTGVLATMMSQVRSAHFATSRAQ